MGIKISVIVPFYGVEKYIARCTESLMCQTMQDGIEFIFVNDATKDSSLDVLKKVLSEYPERKEQVTILHHEINKGLPAARNTGLVAARGKYIYHCDSDDYLEKDALEVLYRKAEENGSDIVWGDFYEIMTGGNRYKKQPAYSTPLDAVKGMLTGEMDYNVWNKLVRRDLYLANNISFPSGYAMGEDLTMIMLFSSALNVAFVSKPVYYYDKTNPSAMTYSMSEEKQNALKHNVVIAENYLCGRYGNALMVEIATLKLNLKWPFLISTDRVSVYKEWNKWFPEANEYITSQFVSSRIKVLELCAYRKQYWVLWLHYWLVIKFYYKMLGK